MITHEEIKAVILYMRQAFPNYNPDLIGKTNTVDVLLDLLGDLDSETLWAAVKSCCVQPRQFAPSAGEIRQEAARLAGKASGVPDAVEAWGAVMDYLKYRTVSPAFEHPMTQHVVRAMGGTTVLGLSENNMADRAHFLKMFQQTVETKLQELAELPVVSQYIDNRRQIEDGVKGLAKRLSGGAPRLTHPATGERLE